MIKFTTEQGDCEATLNGELVTYKRDEDGNVFVCADPPESVALMLHEGNYPEYYGQVKDDVLHLTLPWQPKPCPAKSVPTSNEDNAPSAEPGTEKRRRRARNAE